MVKQWKLTSLNGYTVLFLGREKEEYHGVEICMHIDIAARLLSYNTLSIINLSHICSKAKEYLCDPGLCTKCRHRRCVGLD